MVNFDYSELFSIYKALLTKKQEDVFSIYIECDLSLGEISEKNNISRQGVSDAINKTKEILLGYESKLKLLEKKRQLIKLQQSLSDEDLKSKISKIIEE